MDAVDNHAKQMLEKNLAEVRSWNGGFGPRNWNEATDAMKDYYRRWARYIAGDSGALQR